MTENVIGLDHHLKLSAFRTTGVIVTMERKYIQLLLKQIAGFCCRCHEITAEKIFDHAYVSK